MSKKIYIGCGAGFAGDRFDASIPIVKQLANVNAPKYLIFEVLAERTLALAQQLRNKNSEEGYSPFLDSYINPILEDCLENNIKIVSNIGAANPMGAAKRILEIAEKQKIRKPKIGVVIGDDLLAYMSNSEILECPTMEGLDFSNNEITAANVYLGAQPIADALEKGADINNNKPGIPNQYTPLYYVIVEIIEDKKNNNSNLREKKFEAVKFLLSKGADVNKENNEWKTVLDETATNDEYELTKLLLDKRAEPKQVLDYSANIEHNNNIKVFDNMLKLLIEYAVRDPEYKPSKNAHQRVKDMLSLIHI